MNFTFRTYPAHPWLSKWTIEPRGCGTTFREKNSGHFFHTMKTVGRIAPNMDSAEWFLQIPIPQNSQTHLLFNGFCGYFSQGKRSCSAEVIIPEPGVLWGQISDIPPPVLITNKPIEEEENYQWIESDSLPALLAIRGNNFCLVSKARIKTDAIQLAERYLEQDLDDFLEIEFQHRKGATELFEHMSHHDSLAAISAECMMRAIRPPEGSISTHWSQSKEEGSPQLNTNELHALTLAWQQLDAEIAEELFLGALKLQASSGAIPVIYAPHTTFSILEAPKPLLAKTAEKIWAKRKSNPFANEIIPLLRRHIQWLLHHFDPKRRGLHCWQNNDETFTPESYKSDLATVDLTVLLLTEIEALNRLQKQAPEYAHHEFSFAKEHDALEHNLQTQFWNEKTEEYSNAYIRNKIVPFPGFSTLTPLLWNKLPRRQKSIILDGMQKSGSLPGGLNVLSWRTTAVDEHDFPLLQQLLLLDILKTADSHGSMIRDFTRLMLQGFVEWHTLSIEKNGTLDLDPVMAAYIITLMETHHYRYQTKNTLAASVIKRFRKSKLQRFDIAVITITAVAILSVHTVYNLLHQPPMFTALEAQMNSAYANKNGDEALLGGMQIIEHYPDQSVMAKLLIGNILLVQNNYKNAVVMLSDVRKEKPDSPGPMIALGLAYQLQGNFEQANKNYNEFTYIFDEIFPDLVQEIQRFQILMQEGFKAPPKWPEIYRYQLMHEL
jgi:tetratricopeptide (TPR) repeat protein